MKRISVLHTSRACDDTFDKIELLNKESLSGINLDHIIVLCGHFTPDVFEHKENEDHQTFWRYANQQTHKEITKKEYRTLHEVMPPLYLTHIDGNPVKEGIACSEAFNHTDQGYVVLDCAYKGDDGKYYACLCVMFKSNYRVIRDTYNHHWSKDNVGITYTK